jgi:hypothetical protein
MFTITTITNKTMRSATLASRWAKNFPGLKVKDTETPNTVEINGETLSFSFAHVTDPSGWVPSDEHCIVKIGSGKRETWYLLWPLDAYEPIVTGSKSVRHYLETQALGWFAKADLDGWVTEGKARLAETQLDKGKGKGKGKEAPASNGKGKADKGGKPASKPASKRSKGKGNRGKGKPDDATTGQEAAPTAEPVAS